MTHTTHSILTVRDAAFVAAEWHARRAQTQADAGDVRSREALAVIQAWQMTRLGIGGYAR